MIWCAQKKKGKEKKYSVGLCWLALCRFTPSPGLLQLCWSPHLLLVQGVKPSWRWKLHSFYCEWVSFPERAGALSLSPYIGIAFQSPSLPPPLQISLPSFSAKVFSLSVVYLSCYFFYPRWTCLVRLAFAIFEELHPDRVLSLAKPREAIYGSPSVKPLVKRNTVPQDLNQAHRVLMGTCVVITTAAAWGGWEWVRPS